MPTKQNFKLIDGKFTPSEAGKVLCSLINSKINYHQMELFSNQERFGTDLSNSKKRIEALKEVSNSLKKFFDATAEQNHLLQISGSIEIIVLNDEKH